MPQRFSAGLLFDLRVISLASSASLRAADSGFHRPSTRSGEETRNQAEPGDAVVRNLAGRNEQYLVSADTFPRRYRVDAPLDAARKTCVPLGKVRALEVTRGTADVIGLGDAFWFEAPWHDAQFCAVGDFLVIALPDKGEVYRIGREEFLQTYQPLQDF